MNLKNSFIGWIAVAIAVHAAASEVKKDANHKTKIERRKEGSPFNAQKPGKHKIQRVAQNRADGKAGDSNKEVFEAYVSKVLKQRKPVSRIAQNAGVNSNNVITNVCHPENSQGGFRRRVGNVSRGPRPAVNGVGGSESRSSGICDSTSEINGVLGIGASFAGAFPNPAVGITAGIGAAFTGMILSMNCPSGTTYGITQLREEMIEMMGDRIATNTRDEIANEMEHIADMLEHDEIFPYSIVAAEAYSRDLSLLQDKAYEAFTWHELPIYAAISKAHILMKEYLVPHSFKISYGCGLERLKSLERAKGIAFIEFQNIVDDYDLERTEWWDDNYNEPRMRHYQCEPYDRFEFCDPYNYNDYWSVYYYSWTDYYGDWHKYENNDANLAQAQLDSETHYDTYFHDNVGEYDSIWTENVVNFRNRLLSDNIEDHQACGQIGDEELACNSATGKTYCVQNICVLPYTVFWGNKIFTGIEFIGHGLSAKPLGVISQPGQNFQISFMIYPIMNSEDTVVQTIIRGTNSADYGSYGRTNRHPLIYWTRGKIVVAATDLKGTKWLGVNSPPITKNQSSSITVTYLKDKIVYCNEHDCYSTEAPIDQRPAFDNMYLNLGDKYHEGSPGLNLQVKKFQFTKIMDGYKIFQGALYEVTDYKISDEFQSPTSEQPAFAVIPYSTRKFQISFIIERTSDNPMPGNRCALRFKPDYPYFKFNAGWTLVVAHSGVEQPTLVLPRNEKVHVKFVDLDGDSFFTYVNGKEFEKHISSRPALGSQQKVYKTHNVFNEMGDSGIRISNLHYTYLNPV